MGMTTFRADAKDKEILSNPQLLERYGSTSKIIRAGLKELEKSALNGGLATQNAPKKTPVYVITRKGEVRREQ